MRAATVLLIVAALASHHCCLLAAAADGEALLLVGLHNEEEAAGRPLAHAGSRHLTQQLVDFSVQSRSVGRKLRNEGARAQQRLPWRAPLLNQQSAVSSVTIQNVVIKCYEWLPMCQEHAHATAVALNCCRSLLCA